MNRKKSRLFPKILIGISLIMVYCNSFSLIYDNGAGSGYGGEGEKTSGYSGSTIEGYIIEGAGYFLNGYSDVLLLLNKIEVSGTTGLDFIELNKLLDNAISNIKDSKNTYENLIKVAEITPYSEPVISKLINFDYVSFMMKNGLNSEIFQAVEKNLRNGNITGIFRQNYSDMEYLEGLLLIVKEKVSMNEIPVINKLWKLNQKYASALLYGQYVAQVFHVIN